MKENIKKEVAQKLFKDASEKLSSSNSTIVLKKLNELKSTGNVSILSLILDLLSTSNSEAIKREVLIFVGQLKDQNCVPIVVEYIQSGKAGKDRAGLISACWQSGLDFSKYLTVFADDFITGDYQIALESFTVIEEMLWQTTNEMIQDCRQYLIDRQGKLQTEKQLLFKELIKVLDEGISHNAEDFPEFYGK